MNVLKLCIAGALCLTLGFSSCKDTDDPMVVDMELAKMMASGAVNRVYSRTNLTLYHNDSETGGEWKQINLREYVGWQSALDDEFILMDGSVYAPFALFHISYGPHPLAGPWMAYCKATNCNKELYILSQLDIDEANGNILIGKRWCDLMELTKSRLTVAFESKYVFGESLEVGHSREVNTYAVSENRPDTSMMLCYPSEYELTVDLLSKFRDTFGDSVNLNRYLNGVILEDPIVNFDDLERRLLGDR